MEKQLIKLHQDVITASQEIARLEQEHREIGYRTNRTSPISFDISLDDGKVSFWWEKGKIYACTGAIAD